MDINALIVSELLKFMMAKMKNSAEIAVNTAPALSTFVSEFLDKVISAEKRKRMAANADAAFVAVAFGVNTVFICDVGISTAGDRHHKLPTINRMFMADVTKVESKYPVWVS